MMVSDHTVPSHPIVVIMGVAGSGKTTIGTLLAETLGWTYADADEFHPPVNIAKMSAGEPLSDDDRWPWLEAVAHWIDQRAAAGEPGVVSSSALRRTYRDRLRGNRPQVLIVFLDGSPELIGRRLAARRGHFMKPGMLESQFASLERPEPGERVTAVPIDGTPAGIVRNIIDELGLPAP